jgi:hypothetical protein
VSLSLALCVAALPSPQTADSKPKGISDLLPGHGKDAVPFGPKPSGCSDFEILVGEHFCGDPSFACIC